MRLFITRHGQTTWNLEHCFQGQGDSPLTVAGERQARLLALRLAEEQIDVVVCSDLRRAWRSAEIIVGARDVPIVRDCAWRESSYGAWEGLTRGEIEARDPDLLRRRTADRVNIAPPGGENLRALGHRVVGALDAVHRNYVEQTVLVVTHAGPLIVLACYLNGLELGTWQGESPANCGLSCVRWEGSTHQIEFWDDARHLTERDDG